MNLESINGYTLIDLNKINVILGKNGCGKSTMLRELERGLTEQREITEQSIVSGQHTLATSPKTYGENKYITPERGGILNYTASIEEMINRDANWILRDRRKNLSGNFREQSIVHYRKLETLVLREFENDQSKDKFDSYVRKINLLLDNIEIRRIGATFKIFNKNTRGEINASEISSGESELISLAIELLIFEKELKNDKDNFLFLDEPDVHLHPDLQVRLMCFLEELVNDNNNFKIILATHSTAILGALESYSNTHFAFMTFGRKVIEFNPISSISKEILPIFGAHPLSKVFSEAPILLIEGDDDGRIWQQVVRSSEGKVRVHPCPVEGFGNLIEFEKEAQKIIETVYDGAKGYSLRDRDDHIGEIRDFDSITRMTLSCRESENLLLSDEVLEKLGLTWDILKGKIDRWLELNSDHEHYAVMKDFRDRGYDRKNSKIKKIRNDLMGIIGSEKPWEVVVGQTIANITWNDNTNFNEDGKLLSFLGEKVVKTLLPGEHNQETPRAAEQTQGSNSSPTTPTSADKAPLSLVV